MAQRHPGAKGRLWEDRFKSVIVESGVAARTMAAYIDLNPVRAGSVTDPASYQRMTIGIAGDKNATKPEHELAPQALNGWPLFGKKDNVGDVPLTGLGDDKPIELGIDLTPLLSGNLVARPPACMQSIRMRCLFAFIVVAVCLLANGVQSAVAADQPNIIYFLADDLGWADVGWHGSEIKTPNLDKLASGGAKLEQFYVLPVCSPTRAALLTGRYPIRHGLQVSVIRPWAQYGLPLDERTLPQALKEAGYTTHLSGKWHLGHFQPDYLPTRRGFDTQYGHYNGALNYLTHDRDGGHDWHRNDQECRDEGYTTLLLGSEAVRVVEQAQPGKPFFLYVPFNAPHTPLQAPGEYLKRYAQITDKKRQVYAAMIECLDEQVSRVVAALEQRGLTQNTLVLFSSDNGGLLGVGGATNGKLRAQKGTLYEGGTRVCAFANWPGHIKPGTVVTEPLHIVDWFPTLVNLAGGSLQQHPLDGRDIWPVITAGKPSPHEDILINAMPNSGAIRMGGWKLVVNGHITANDLENAGAPMPGAKKAADSSVELFNLTGDPYEQNNLATQNPELVRQLRARLEAYQAAAVPPKAENQPANHQPPRVWGQ